MLVLINFIKIFNEIEDNKFQNKMINSLANRKIYINDNTICLIFIDKLFNLSNNLKKSFSTCEIFLNIIQMNNYIPFDKINEYNHVLDLIISNFPFNEFV